MNRGASADRGSDTDAHRYRLTSTWHLAARSETVWAVFEDLVAAPDPFVWWPDLQVLGRDDDGIDVLTRSGLGYRLRFRLHDITAGAPTWVTFAAVGDLTGSGRVELQRAPGDGSVLHITWDVRVTRAWMRRVEPVLRPVFVLAHRAVMLRGRRALERWLAPSAAGRRGTGGAA